MHAILSGRINCIPGLCILGIFEYHSNPHFAQYHGLRHAEQRFTVETERVGTALDSSYQGRSRAVQPRTKIRTTSSGKQQPYLSPNKNLRSSDSYAASRGEEKDPRQKTSPDRRPSCTFSSLARDSCGRSNRRGFTAPGAYAGYQCQGLSCSSRALNPCDQCPPVLLQKH